jgi:hypothetical protein
MVAGDGSVEGEVGSGRVSSIWREAHRAVLTADGGNDGGGGFNSSENRWAPVARGGQAAIGGQEGGRGVLARLGFTQRGEWRSVALGRLDAEAKRRKGGGGGPAQRTSKWRRKGGWCGKWHDGGRGLAPTTAPPDVL